MQSSGADQTNGEYTLAEKFLAAQTTLHKMEDSRIGVRMLDV